MNSRTLIASALGAGVAMCVYLLGGGRPSVSTMPPVAASGGRTALPTTGIVRSDRATGDPSGAGEKKSAVNWKRLASLSSLGESPVSIPEPTTEDVARFLEKHGETPANLVAAFEKTRDHALIERALALFPGSPIVLMAAIESLPAGASPQTGETYRPDAQRMAFLERFKAADPSNPLPWIFSAQELFKAKQTDEAVAEIRAALDRPAFYTYANERMDSAQRLYEATGVSPIEASVLAMAGLTLPHMSAANQASRSLMEWQKSAAGSGDSAASDEALRLTYNLGRTFATPEASRTLIGQLVGIAMESRALKALPVDTQPGWLAVAPAQRLAEMETQSQTVRQLVASSEWLYRSEDEQLWAEYLRRNRSDGELSALTWLKTQQK